MLAVGAAAMLVVGAAPALAAPVDGEVKLTSVYAAPIAPTEPQCTPEPGGQRIYGTQKPFDPLLDVDNPTGFGDGYPASAAEGPASAYYRPANMRSRDTITPALQAGASNDLCFGFTLTPNMESGFQIRQSPDNGNRLQNDPLLPDVKQTHVLDGQDGDDLKKVSIDLPAGFVGDPDSLPTCTDAQFGFGNYRDATCPTNSTAGTVFARVSILSGTLPQHLVLGGLANRLSPPNSLLEGGFVYNLTHGPDELARLGLLVQPAGGVAPVKLIVRLGLAPDGSGRIRTTVDNAPRRTFFVDDIDEATGQPIAGSSSGTIYLETIGIRAWGAAGNGRSLIKDFGQWGTNCTDPITATASVETYAGTKSSMASSPLTLTGCDALPFNPTVSVETAEKRPAVPTATTIKVGVDQPASGPRAALLKNATLTLPAGLELGAQVASGPGGLPLCSGAQFGFSTQDVASTCPAGSKVGDVRIATPLLTRPFVGSVFLGEQPAVGELPGLYIEATPEGATAADAPRIKLRGAVTVDGNGIITTTVLGAPELRFSELKIDFPGGPNALFTTPRTCGETSGTSQLTSWAKPTAPVSVESKLTIDQACDLPGFAPSFAMSSADATAGASAATTVSIGRTDRSPWLKDVKVSLPLGFIADLGSAAECGAGPAASGACPEASRIATVTTVAGVGEAPLALTGQMYLAERQSGAVAGAVIVVRAKIGEIDLGDVVVPARIDLRPTDAGLVLTTTAPTRFKGLALNLREIRVAIDRPGFPLNPTSCGPLRATAEIASDAGNTAAPTTDVTYTGCAQRPFQPAIAASLGGTVAAGQRPDLKVTVTPRRGDSNLKSTTVVLPNGISTDPRNIQIQCTLDQFAASACPAASRKGSVAVNVAITPETLPGDLYLIAIPGENLPGIGMNITGRYAQRIISRIKIQQPSSRLIAIFETIPDIPITKLDLTINGGAAGPLQLGETICNAASAFEATFGGQGGQSSKTNVPFDCTSPKIKSTLKWSRKSGMNFVFSPPAGKTLKSAKVTLPKGFKFTKSKTARKKYLKVTTSGGKTKTKFATTSLSATKTGKANPKKITFKVGTRGYTLPKTKTYRKGLKKGAKIKVKVRAVTNDGKVTSSTVTVKVS